ncbi:MAG TPA: alpha-galactosidase [Clostridia bacterium]|nr:alpha-galactosidase [Clostridia bacterium]
MRNFVSVELAICYSDNTLIKWDTDQLSKTHFEDSNHSIDLEVCMCGKCHEVKLNLTARKPREISYIELIFVPKRDFIDENLYYFFNGHSTNQFVFIRPFSESKKTDINRGVTVMLNKKTGSVFNIAFSTIDRFMTRFVLDGREITARMLMEDKALAPNETARLENILFDETIEAKEFLEFYASTLGNRYNARKSKVLSGWCAWSYYYSDVDHEKMMAILEDMRPFLKYGANVVQIDGGWQIENALAGKWVPDEKKFPEGMRPFTDRAHELGMIPGVWHAPLLMGTNSPFVDECADAMVKDENGNLKLSGFYSNYAVDIGSEKGLKLIHDNFHRAKHEYGFDYYKLDFMMGGITRRRTDDSEERFASFDGDYCAALYRRAMKTIRNAVGEDSYIVGCGTILPENTGIFDAMRIGQDITWGKVKEFPNYWDLIKDNCRNVFLRYFYHRRMFINDSDGLILRDYSINDGFDGSYEEVKLWATTVALSGGLVLLNEKVSKLGPERLKLFTGILPVYGVEAKPVDFFEYPYPTKTQLRMLSDTQLVSFFNWDDKKMLDMELNLADIKILKPVAAVNAWSKEYTGLWAYTFKASDVMPHGAESYIIKPISDKPEFFYAESNFYCGADRILSSYDEASKTLTVYMADGSKYPECAVCIMHPDNYTPQAEHTKVQTEGKTELLFRPAESSFEERKDEVNCSISVSRFVIGKPWSEFKIVFSKE